MRPSLVRRCLTGVVVSALVVGSLAGCFLIPQRHGAAPTAVPSPSSNPTGGAYAVGDCWNVTFDTFSSWSSWANWQGKAAVSCSQKHQTYTFAAADVLTLTEAPFNTSGVASDEARQQAYDFCSSEFTQLLGIEYSDVSRFIVSYFLPSRSRWKEGAHWVRCDLAIIKPGTALAKPELADLPATIGMVADVLADSPNHFDTCVSTGDGWTGYGPWESESAEYSFCEEPHEWILHGEVTYPGERYDPYPGDEAMQNYASEHCLTDVPVDQPGYTYTPDADSWRSFDRHIECWLYLGDAPSAPAV